MDDSSNLLTNTRETTSLGNAISLKMVAFMDQVKVQPVGFRELGLDFLSICQILNALEESLKEHFKTQQPFPRQAVPELTKIMSQTVEDFKQLQALLEKFMDYEKGGAFAKLQKTWRLVFADKEIAKVRTSLHANKGALTMAMLLTNINPTGAHIPQAAEFTALAAKLNHAFNVSSSVSLPEVPNISELPGDSALPQELPGTVVPDTSIYGSPRSETVSALESESQDYNPRGPVTPSISEMSISDRIPEPSIVSALDSQDISPRTVFATIPSANGPREVSKESAQTQPELIRVRVDPTTLKRRVPKQSSGAGNSALQKALLSAVTGNKSKIVEQLLDRGVSPETGPEKFALVEAVYHADIDCVRLLLEFGADPNAKASNGFTALGRACEFNKEEKSKLLLDYGADPNLISHDWTPLCFAMNTGKESLVRLVLSYGGDPDSWDSSGKSVLEHTCERKLPTGLVEDIIRYSSDLNKKSKRGQTALCSACLHNRPETIKLLLAHGADPNLSGSELPIVAASAHPACLEPLIAVGADLSKRKGILELATYHNSIASVTLLLDAGVDINEKTRDIYSPLTTAIRDNRQEILQLLLSKGADPNLKGQDMPLILATQRPVLLKILLDHGVDMAKCPGAVEVAVYHNQIESVKMLLDAGADINYKQQGIYTPLTTAIRDNRPQIVALLISRGADLNLKGQDIPLEMATQRIELLKQLVAAGADVAKCPGIMEIAVVRNQVESVRFLLDAGVNPQDKKNNIYTPLSTAVRDNRPEIVALLLSRGADPNFKGQDLPLILALSRPSILKQLVEGGADVTKYKGLLELAVYHNKIDSVEILLEAGVPVDEKHRDIYTPLTTAIRDNRIDILKHLISKGADVNLVGENLPIILAAQFPESERLSILLDAGADVNISHKKRTALMEACERNLIENVKLLLGKGADVDAVNGSGNSAMDIAANRGHDDIVMLLLDSMG